MILHDSAKVLVAERNETVATDTNTSDLDLVHETLSTSDSRTVSLELKVDPYPFSISFHPPSRSQKLPACEHAFPGLPALLATTEVFRNFRSLQELPSKDHSCRRRMNQPPSPPSRSTRLEIGGIGDHIPLIKVMT